MKAELSNKTSNFGKLVTMSFIASRCLYILLMKSTVIFMNFVISYVCDVLLCYYIFFVYIMI